MTNRLEMQMAFLNELEKLKVVYRRNNTIDRARSENSAEHSWHVAMMALVLSEHCDASSVDMFRVIQMLLVHDLVEIYAGDTWVYDQAEAADQLHREALAAERLFGLLPEDQADWFRSLWQEFESRSTPEAAYAAAVDSLQPLANHLLAGTQTEKCPTRDQVIAHKSHIREASGTLWDLAQYLIHVSTNKGLYRMGENQASHE